ncbi:MAG: RluA family pseudouridine synthase [Clostridia bacterium]
MIEYICIFILKFNIEKIVKVEVEMVEYCIEKAEANKRLDVYMSFKQNEITRSYIKTLINDSKILVNGLKVKAGYVLKVGDNITFDKPEDVVAKIIPENIDLDIIYEDKDIIVLDKKKGMVVHPANGNYTKTLVNALMYSHVDELSTINGVVRPGIVHRIDKDTTGILVVAKNDDAHKILAEQFRVHSIKRKYIALVKKIIKDDNIDISLPIGRDEKDRKKMAVTYKNSREAITHIAVIKRYYESNLTLVEATLETGRTHQIRVHMSYIGHPILGDLVYGKKDKNFKVLTQMLHAYFLGIIHPSTGKYMEFKCNVHEDFKELLQKLEEKEKAL